MGLIYNNVPLSPWSPDAADFVESNLNVRDFYQIFGRMYWPTADLAFLAFPGVLPDGPGGGRIKLGRLWWPRGASRFASIHLLADDAQLLAMRGGTLSTALGLPLPFTMSWQDAGANGVTVGSITTNLMALPPLPLSSIGGSNGVNLLTLVDDRWNFWTRPEGNVTVVENTTTWLDLYALLAAALGITLSIDAIPSAYLKPSKLFTTYYEYLPLLLDAIAYNVGQRIVRYLDGTCAARNFANSLTDIAANLALPSARSLVGGGFIATNDISNVTAGTLEMIFPKLVGGVLTVPPYEVSKPTGATGSGTKSLHSLTIYDGTNATQLAALATQAALDYAAQFKGGGDWKFAGVVPWKQEAIDDAVEWCHNAVGGQQKDGEVSTRIYPPPWNDLTDQLLISGSAGSGPLPGSLTVENTDGTEIVFGCTLIEANDDLGDVLAYNFGRIHWTLLTATSGQLDWQGFRIYTTGTGYKGPEPDLEFIAGANITISVADDPGDKRTQVTISAMATSGTVATMNLDATQPTNPATVIKFNNDMGDVSAYNFGRMHTTDLGGGVAKIDWQGFRIYMVGIGYKGPEPDLEFVAGTGIAITINDDVADKRTQVGISATVFSVETINLDATQDTNPAKIIKFNNDMGAVKFGRMHTQDLGAGVAQIDWQGLRLYKSGVGYVGPEPDIEFQPGYGLVVVISDDAADKRVVVAESVALTENHATLVSDVTLTSVWADLGALSLTMPAGAGTYLIQASLTGFVNVNVMGGGQAWVEVRLRNTSAGGGGATIGSMHVAVESQNAGADNMATATPMAMFTAAGGEVITCQARYNGAALGAVTAKILRTATGDTSDIGGSYMLRIRIA